MNSAAEHATAKFELQRAGRNRHWATSPKKYSDPIAKQIYGKNWGAYKSNAATGKPNL
ncbi:hypothetical protein F2Q69_00022841 [Brassica cretica]|uniref:Uncharacterized protein n=1 Tax=Brassica cretica TaxID=69181 RepID=A0A8S9QG51_BRACR|nr:hypothetical protein F2Q69_00022841 [Brassica cretica]